jgi:hypothetical protein
MDRRPVDVSVQQADAIPEAGERHGKIRRDRGLPYASFAAGNGHDVAHVRDE